MQLTSENYYSKEANEEYLSVSQYKDFMGTYGKRGCEEYALAKIEGTWEENMEDSDALMVGSYVDAHFEGTLDLFKAKHPCMFKKDGGLMAKYLKANEMIQRCERDEVFSHYMSGEKQVIMTADMFGAKWKIKIDSYHPGQCIVDLKTCQSINKVFFHHDIGYMNFLAEWGYYIQGAVYQKVVEINTGKKLPFFIAAVSKEKVPDIQVIAVEQNLLDEALAEVEHNVPMILPASFMVVAPGSWNQLEVWDDINRMRTLNTTQSRRRAQMHVCPLQLDIVERIINRYSNEGDIVYDPFGGLMTVPMTAVKTHRYGKGCELNPDYFRDGVGYLQSAENEVDEPTLFDLFPEVLP